VWIFFEKKCIKKGKIEYLISLHHIFEIDTNNYNPLNTNKKNQLTFIFKVYDF